MATDRVVRRRRRAPRGATLVEVMIAMGITMVGALGLSSLNTLGLRYVGDGRRITRATAIAEDLANQISLWTYDDARLSNPNTGNDDDPGDAAYALESAADATPLVDHVEGDLGATWPGIPAADLATGGYERYWNVSLNDPAVKGALLDGNLNTIADAKRIAVIVRWPQGTGWRRVVVYVTKPNPADAL
jgi:Tfp pilus assembly protein PilV